MKQKPVEIVFKSIEDKNHINSKAYSVRHTIRSKTTLMQILGNTNFN